MAKKHLSDKEFGETCSLLDSICGLRGYSAWKTAKDKWEAEYDNFDCPSSTCVDGDGPAASANSATTNATNEAATDAIIGTLVVAVLGISIPFLMAIAAFVWWFACWYNKLIKKVRLPIFIHALLVYIALL